MKCYTLPSYHKFVGSPLGSYFYLLLWIKTYVCMKKNRICNKVSMQQTINWYEFVGLRYPLRSAKNILTKPIWHYSEDISDPWSKELFEFSIDSISISCKNQIIYISFLISKSRQIIVLNPVLGILLHIHLEERKQWFYWSLIVLLILNIIKPFLYWYIILLLRKLVLPILQIPINNVVQHLAIISFYLNTQHNDNNKPLTIWTTTTKNII